MNTISHRLLPSTRESSGKCQENERSSEYGREERPHRMCVESPPDRLTLPVMSPVKS